MMSRVLPHDRRDESSDNGANDQHSRASARVPVYNPYKKSNINKKKTVERLMEAGKCKKPDMVEPGKVKPKVAQAKAAKKKQDKDRSESNESSDKGDRGSWRKHAQLVLLAVSGALRDSAQTIWTVATTCSLNRQNLFGDAKLDVPPDLSQEDFSLPDLVMWAPELRWPQMHPNGTPHCPFCKATSCVKNKGWESHFRRCCGPRGDVALQGKRHVCENTKKSFCSYDPDVMSQAPNYVQAFWRENGHHLTHKSGGEFILLLF
jgi:hypothetical protein